MTDATKLLAESPSQTAGPYLHIGLMPNFAGIAGIFAEDPGSVLVDAKTRGERISITGCVCDGEGEPLRDAVLEIWQADAKGIYPSVQNDRGAGERGPADPHFAGWGRCAADFESGEFRFDTIKPGRVPYPEGGLQAPHVTLWIVARGINIGLHTRIYFADEADANADDPLLARVSAERRDTLIAAPQGDGRYRFDVRLQGERETVFLDI